MKQKPSYLVWAAFALTTAVIVFLVLTFTGITGKDLDATDYNLLVITLDTTRADHIGAYGYNKAQTPNLDRLAREGVMFFNCYSPVPVTLPSHSSIFTGRYPLGHGVRDNGAFFLADEETTLAEKMKELPQGYQTYGVIASFVLMSKFGLKQGFDHYDDSLNAGQLITNYDSEIRAQQVYEKFSNWFSHQREAKKPFFAWLHFYDPHTPYDPPEPFNKEGDNGLQGKYDGELAYTDSFVGKIIADLKAAGQLQHTLLVITGDHGEAFGEHNEYGHSLFCYQENIKVPLIFYNTSLFKKGLKVKSPVNLIDIMPTLLELYQLSIPADVHGKSIANLLRGKKESKKRTFYAESMHGKEELGWAPLMSIIDGEYKYISLPEPELYHLEADPNEKTNLFRKKNYLSKNMDKKLSRLVKGYSTPKASGGDPQRHLTGSDKQHLQSLGYISAFSAKSATNLDPKKGILLKNRMNQIEALIDNNDLNEALTELKKVASQNRKSLLPQYFGALNRIYKQQNKQDKVMENWQNAIDSFPQNDNFKINLAFEYFHKQQLQEAQQTADAILKNNDKYTRAYILKSKILEQQKRIPAALPFLEKAILLEPHNVSLKISLARLLSKKPDLKRAAEICQPLLSDPTIVADIDLKSQLAVLLTEINQNDQAEKLLLEVTQSSKASAEAWNYLGIIHFRKGRFKQAQDAYNRSLKKDDNVALTYNNMGTLYLTLFLKQKTPQLHQQALDAFNKALKYDPNLASALNGRASAYKFINRSQDALKDWKKALVVNPSFIDVYFNIAITYLQLNNKSAARTYLNQCKEKFYQQLPPRVQQRLDRLIAQTKG
jgi:arylsulfatase A-like enzyme/Flp pilus assembly protein TadD